MLFDFQLDRQKVSDIACSSSVGKTRNIALVWLRLPQVSADVNSQPAHRPNHDSAIRICPLALRFFSTEVTITLR
jgi:hypothetical protein